MSRCETAGPPAHLTTSADTSDAEAAARALATPPVTPGHDRPRSRVRRRPSSGADAAAPSVDAPASASANSQSSETPRQLRDPMEAPVRKLSVDLIRTYKRINQVYYDNKKLRQDQLASAATSAAAAGAAPPRAPSPASTNAPAAVAARPEPPAQPPGAAAAESDAGAAAAAPAAGGATGTVSASSSSSRKRTFNNNGVDDEHSDYIIRVGECLHARYVVQGRLGKGSFGQVVRAWDEQREALVAVKIIKSRKPFFEQAKTEVALLEELNQKDPNDNWCVVRMLDTFVHLGHQCLVFEMLSYNLYDLIRHTHFNGVSLNLVRKFGRQILHALHFLSRPDVNVIHCDLKPENVLLRHSKRSAIKVIDFGSSCKGDRQMYQYIQSRFYRSPEVVLGCRYGVEIDVWSLGCILVEMHTGEPLFSGADEHEQVLRLVAARGMPPDAMIAAASKRLKFFQPKTPDEAAADRAQLAQLAAASPESADQADAAARSELASAWRLRARRGRTDAQVRADVVKYRGRTLRDVLGLGADATRGPAVRRAADPAFSRAGYDPFIHLVERMLDYDPARRIKPRDALAHAFMAGSGSSGAAPVASSAACTAGAAPEEARKSARERELQRRPGSAPAASSQSGGGLRRSSRVAKQQEQQEQQVQQVQQQQPPQQSGGNAA